LADEINRAPAKVQSALLEAMQERQVTLGDQTHALPSPFLVMATQNPIEQEGTYPLPEAQIDRFLLKVNVGYPTPDEELRILDAMATSAPRLEVRPVVSLNEILTSRQLVDAIYIDEKIKRYIVSLVVATRTPRALGLSLDGLIRYGASPRASIGITMAAKAWAFLRGRGYVTPQDVKAVAADVLRHRVAVTYEAEAGRVTADGIVTTILDHIAIP
jgi:MoxR-like ATPase